MFTLSALFTEGFFVVLTESRTARNSSSSAWINWTYSTVRLA